MSRQRVARSGFAISSGGKPGATCRPLLIQGHDKPGEAGNFEGEIKMKKLFASSLLLLAASNVIWGAPITGACTPSQGDVVISSVGTSQLFDCAPGVVSNQIRINVSGSFQDNANGTPGGSLSVLYTSVTPFGIAPSCTASGVTNADGQTLGACTATDWGWVNVAQTAVFVSPFQVTVTGGAGSDPLPFNGSASVSFETEAIPEPATYATLGLGLIGFYMVRRRRA